MEWHKQPGERNALPNNFLLELSFSEDDRTI